MKILHVTQGYTPAIGGTEIAIQRISENLVQQFGDEVTVFTTNCYNGEAFYTPGLRRMPLGWEEINGVKVRRFPVASWISRLFNFHKSIGYPGNQYLRNFYNGPLIFGLADAIRRADFDVLCASSFPLMHMFTSVRAARDTNRPVVLFGGLHPEDVWGFQRPMIYQAIQKADQYISNTQYEANFVIEQGVDPQKINTIGVGVDIERFENASRAEARARLGLPDEIPLVAFIGQMGAHKGVDTLLRAMPKVWQVMPQAHLLLAGAKTLFSETIDRFLASLPEAARQKVHLHYNFTNEEKPWLFAATDIFTYPSGYESFGIAFVEAWAVKKPVIGTWRGAIPWVVQAGRDGLLVEFQNETALAEAILTLLRNPEYARRLGEAGYQKARNRYNWPAISQRFREVYLKALEDKRRPAGRT